MEKTVIMTAIARMAAMVIMIGTVNGGTCGNGKNIESLVFGNPESKIFFSFIFA